MNDSLERVSAWGEAPPKESGDDVVVDTAVYNPARITKLYGSLVCKGDNLPQRPHRRSQILEVPALIRVVEVP
jgi:hypothetical protein